MLNTLEHTDGDLYVNNLTIVLDKMDAAYLDALVARFPNPVPMVLVDSHASIPMEMNVDVLEVKAIAPYEASGVINSSSDYSLITNETLKKAICKELIGSLHPMVMEAPVPPADFDYSEALFILCLEDLHGAVNYSLAYIKK
ncbi:hypothetical protein PHOBOS_218 [Erwinia phage vB_EamM_Phobos]|uniref:hypothetical protein n=1 Tax=Erwinia phage vB_EamM_Phobos TaxID=1883377 RepID=UPI00081CE10C|nr:hypothetical protein BIZ79_gp218 [Erwinia phage vB_EamM_Phobos]ANZ50408.1 hypothetical protein PHOBOS_218 [Erwinia phage vB_EamM_Phobos]